MIGSSGFPAAGVQQSHGIVALSLGGTGGHGASGGVIGGSGSDGGTAGVGGAVLVSLSQGSTIQTGAPESYGIIAQASPATAAPGPMPTGWSASRRPAAAPAGAVR